MGGKLRISIKGWVDASCETGVREWDFREVMEMSVFVIGFWKRGNRIKRQVKGFGMGLPCAPQMANLACYIPEREFASLCKAEEVAFNFRFIDDILTLTGKVPSEECYGMNKLVVWSNASGAWE